MPAGEISPSELVASLAAGIHEEPGPASTSILVARRTVDLLPSADHASITIRRRRGTLRMLGASSELASQVDSLQLELREGPCLVAVSEPGWLRSGEVADDERWPRWGARAAALGVGSLLSVSLLSQGEVFGALTAYAADTGRFHDRDEIDTAQLWATHASAALAHVRKVRGLETALASRHLIGMAQGMLMERFGFDEEQSFSLLTRLSSTRNEKVRDLAAHLVRSKRLPTSTEVITPD